MLDSLDKEIVPQPSFGSNYDNERNRLQLNVLDLEVNSQTSENEDERSKHNKKLANITGKNITIILVELNKVKREGKFHKFLVDYSQNFDMRDDYKRFFKKTNFDSEVEEIFNKTFYEFPIFSMNKPYLKAIGNIIAIKVKQIYDMKNQT